MEFLLFFIVGLIFGSFLNVLIYRSKNDRRFGGRSFCPHCKTTLNWHDLVPILSFFWLGRNCRYCQKKISWQYPIVEILSGFIWVLVFWKIFALNSLYFWGFSADGQFLNSLKLLDLLNFLYYILVLSVFLVIAVYDFKWKIIPNKIVYSAIALSFIYNIFLSFIFDSWQSYFFWPLITACVVFVFFFLIHFFSNGEAMGLGDAKLAFLIGLFLNPLLSAAAFMLSFVLGAAFGIILICFQKKSWKSQIAFGPFLVLGVFIVFFFSNFIFNFFRL